MLTLAAQKRDVKESIKGLRQGGFLPVVYYGPKTSSTSVAVKSTEFLKVWKEAGESAMVELEAPEGKIEALIYDVTFDPVTHAPVHADFYVPEKGKKVTVAIPLEFIGVSPAVKDFGGLLVKVLHEIEVEALPKDLPHVITVDISALKDFESQIAVKDLALPEGVIATADEEDMVAAISEAQEEKEIAPSQDLSSIEVVEKKGKKEEAE